MTSDGESSGREAVRPMKVLLTGSEGLIGQHTVAALREDGHDIVRFDARRGQDVRDVAAVVAASAGCQAVIHLAALMEGNDHDIFEVNVLGTWNVLEAARLTGIRRVVFASSVDVLGIFEGEGRPPDYLPLDDDHPTYPRSAYAWSKLIGEQFCAALSRDTGSATICLRFPGIFGPVEYARIIARRTATPEYEYRPLWQYGAFLDVRDAAAALRCALECPDPGHATLLVTARDISATRPSVEMVRMLLPEVAWRGGEEYMHEPFRALIDSSRAQRVLGWRAEHSWPSGT